MPQEILRYKLSLAQSAKMVNDEHGLLKYLPSICLQFMRRLSQEENSSPPPWFCTPWSC